MPYDPFDNTDPPAASRDIHQRGQTVFHHEPSDLWLVAGHHAVRAVLTGMEQFSNDVVLAPVCPSPAVAGPILAGMRKITSVITVDPPEHARRRAALNDVFPHDRGSVRQRWGDQVSRRVSELVDGLAETAEVDVADLAARITLAVLCDVLGLPAGDQDDLRNWTIAFTQFAWSDLDEPGQHVALENAAQMWQYCQRTVTERADSGTYGEGVVGDLLRYRDDRKRPLAVDEVVGEVLNLVGAGWITTASAICHVIEQALAVPGAWARLAVDNLYLHALVTEALRLRPPIVGWQRRTTRAVTIGDVTIAPGSRCLLLLGAANRDPEAFRDPDRFDLERPNNRRHLTFGVGARRCIGEQLALLEITTTVRALAQRLPQFQVDPDQPLEYDRSAVLLQRRTLRATTGCPIAHAVPEEP
jgi:cytochrome P450